VCFLIAAWIYLKYEVLRHILEPEDMKLNRPTVTVLTALIDDDFYYKELIFAKWEIFLRNAFRINFNC